MLHEKQPLTIAARESPAIAACLLFSGCIIIIVFGEDTRKKGGTENRKLRMRRIGTVGFYEKDIGFRERLNL